MEIGDFRKSLRRTVGIPVALLIVLAVVLTSQVWYVVSSLHQVDRTDRVISDGRLLMRFFLDMETGSRGYLLTGDSRFLEPYREAGASLPGTWDALKAGVADDPVATLQVQDLQSNFDKWQKYAERMIQLRANGHNAADVEMNLEGKRLMDAVRESRETLLGSQQEERNRQSRTAWRATIIMLPGLGLLTVGVGLMIASLTRKRILALSETYAVHLRSERERQEEVRRSREWLMTTLRSIGEGVIATDGNGKVVLMNPVAERLTGWAESQARGRGLDEVFVSFNERTHELLASNDFLAAAHQGVFTNHTILRSRTGNETHIDRTAAPIQDTSGQIGGSVVVFRDQTERYKAEDALRSSERLALIGRLSATIAHEIRNPLDSVISLLYLARQSSKSASEIEENLKIADEELGRIAQITRQLLSFSREAKKTVEVDVAELMESALTLYRPKLSMSDIAVEKDFRPHPLINGYPGELRQVLSNLIANAIEASPRGSKIFVRIAAASDWRDSLRPGLHILVSDCGSGIPEEARAGLFQPFYTTKGERGTGLGLWVSRGIVEKHEGYIRYRTSTIPGRSGTSFRVFLPVTQRITEPA